MFGVNKDRLFHGLSVLSDIHCGYTREARQDPVTQHHARCDCKYGYVGRGAGSEQTGCPEAMQAAELIRAMTPFEFARICRRAHVIVSSPMAPPAPRKPRRRGPPERKP